MEIRLTIFIVALLIPGGLGVMCIILCQLLGYEFRRNDENQVAWAAVQRVDIVPKKQQACIVYDAPNYKGVIKTFSLVFALNASSFPDFAQQVQQYVPVHVAEGPFGGLTTIRAWVWLIATLIISGLIIAAISRNR